MEIWLQVWLAISPLVVGLVIIFFNDKRLLFIIKQNNRIMGEEVNINAALDKVQAALENIANDIRKLGEDVAGGVSKAEAVKITARANAIADTAQALADVTPGGEETPETPVEETPAP